MLRVRRRWGRAAVLTGVLGLTAGAVVSAVHATADTRPTTRSTPATVSADALPTVQVDGVVWSQAVVGTTVYAGGHFSRARPAGAAPGTKQVKRYDLLAYDLRTGVLNSRFAPTFNGQVLTVVASPDGKRIYVGGEFTTVNGQARNRIAAFDTATGKLVTSFAPSLDQRVRGIVVTSRRVYAGGSFSTANGVRRGRLAAFSTSDGALLGWAPSADQQVLAMVAAPGGSRIVVGGQFTTLNGVDAYGLGTVDADSGAASSVAVTQVVRDATSTAGITSLATDGSLVYGTGYDFGEGGNFEGTFAMNASGALVWLEDCHGDTYAAAPVGGVVYTVGHAHNCATIGGFPEVNPRTHHRALAFTTAARSTVQHNLQPNYADFAGNPAPAPLYWYPDLTPGTYTGQNQAAWTVTATSSYVLLGGEFTAVNGTKQQGLVRFAVSSLAPNKQGPRATAADLALSVTPTLGGQAQVLWHNTWDRDNQLLTYTVTRADQGTLTSSALAYPFWRGSIRGYTDTGLTPGRQYTYRVTVTDPFGNAAKSASVTVTAR